MEDYTYKNTNYADDLPINLYDRLKHLKKEDIDYIIVYTESPIDQLTNSLNWSSPFMIMLEQVMILSSF